MRIKPNRFILALFLSIFLLSGCSTQEEITYLSSEESAQIALSTDPIAQNIITAIYTNDYSMFISDFDDKMQEAINEEQFEAIVKLYGKNGAAESILLLTVEDRDPFLRANYGVTYTDASLTMRIVVSKTDPSMVTGLWFN